MGDCMSRKASESIDPRKAPYPQRKFFRQSSILGGSHRNDEDPWKERMEYQDVFGCLPPETKETVLQNVWNKTPEKSKGEVPNIEIVDQNESNELLEDDHYDTINEKEIKSIHATTKEVYTERKFTIGLPLPPRPQAGKAENNPMEQLKQGTDECDFYDDDEETSRCLEYSEMVNIFKPLIVQNLLVHDILPSLPFLENHDDIYADVKNHSPKNAVVSLIKELERSKELGKWQKFIDALNANGYTYIVDNIRGYKFISHEYQREYIKKLTPKIGKMIVPSELLPHLIAKNLISDSDKENIQREEINHGNFAAAVVLLDRIHRKHRNWYIIFIEALIDAKMDDIAADLQIPELLDNKRTKVTDVYQENDEKNQYYLPPAPNMKVLMKTLKNKPKGLQSNTYDVDNLNGYSSDESSDSNEYEEYEKRIVTTTDKGKPFAPLIPPKTPSVKKIGAKIAAMVRQECQDMTSKERHFECKDTHEFKSDVADIKFKPLMSELKQMESDHCEIKLEVGLLEKKYSLFTEITDGIRKKREILNAIALKEKESEALKTDSDENGDADDAAIDNADAYYPPLLASNKEEHKQIAASMTANVSVKQLFDYRDLFPTDHTLTCCFPLPAKSHESVVEIYTPHFARRGTIYELFEKDSGVLDMGTEVNYIL